ncbi:hypothetical protein [Azotobacter vinelandii]|uniref:hypothetical protein n=1 Tax=Azotobacter vinelandii TaxID=354 RepID=UPI0026661C31|nr:hypothetical protein [Azotobacter vinelandii]WKN23574.1 hypothetical protein AVAEIV_001652 [Azotobacter vinelandii]
MLNQLERYERIAVLLTAVVMAASALLLCLGFVVAPKYTDFFVGNLTWFAGSKLQDLIVGSVFIIVSFSALLFLGFIMEQHKTLFGSGFTLGLSNQLMWWSLSAIAVISSLILGGT